MNFNFLTDHSRHREVWSLALPMMLAGLTTPLLGMVDTAVVGHLDGPQYLAAVGVGALVFSFLFWGLGFLRMGVSGLTAQAWGAGQKDELILLLLRGAVIALVLGGLLIASQVVISDIAFHLIEMDSPVEREAGVYFDIRIWSAPAVLLNYLLLGWFLGTQNARASLYLSLCINLVNLILDLVLVPGLGMKTEGVAIATVVAEYSGLLFGLHLLFKQPVSLHVASVPWRTVFSLSEFRRLFEVNINIFIRTLCLIGSFAFFTAQSAQMGTLVLAANTVLLNFQTFMAYALDGLAHAAQALIGKYIGAGKRESLADAMRVSLFWSVVVALLFVVSYAVFGQQILGLLTDLPEVLEQSFIYLPWLIVAPLLSVWSYWLDGVFIGAAWSVYMRNTMLLSTAVFIVFWYVSLPWGNQGLWFSFMMFMLARGVTMAWVLRAKKEFLFNS